MIDTYNDQSCTVKWKNSKEIEMKPMVAVLCTYLNESYIVSSTDKNTCV